MRQVSQPYRIIAHTMIFVMVCSSLSFSLDLHYCQGSLKSIDFFGKAKNCHEMAKVSTACHHKKTSGQLDGCSEGDTDCCTGKTLYVQSDQDQQIQSSDIVANGQLQNSVVVCVFALLEPNGLVGNFVADTRYKPPLIQRDIPIFIQSFLL